MRRRKPDPRAWRETEKGRADYRAAKERAQADANVLGIDVGIEANDLFRTWHVFLLPKKEFRCGHELRCEVVSPLLGKGNEHG